MSDYNNLRIRTIAIPDYDDDGKKTGAYTTYEVAGMVKLKSVVNTFEGGSISEDKLYYVCFRKMLGLPKKLYVIDIQTDGEIEVLKYEHEINEPRGGSKARRGTHPESRGDSNP